MEDRKSSKHIVVSTRKLCDVKSSDATTALFQTCPPPSLQPPIYFVTILHLFFPNYSCSPGAILVHLAAILSRSHHPQLATIPPPSPKYHRSHHFVNSHCLLRKHRPSLYCVQSLPFFNDDNLLAVAMEDQKCS